MSIRMDEIGRLARNYFHLHQSHALVVIENNISRAIGGGRWDEFLKWSRVKRRIIRLSAIQYRPPRKHRPTRGQTDEIIGFAARSMP